MGPVDPVENRMKFPELVAPEDREKVIRNHMLRRKDPERAPRNYPCRVKVSENDIKECILTVALIRGTRQSVVSITVAAVTHVYYIIRESVTNAAKHGSAAAIEGAGNGFSGRDPGRRPRHGPGDLHA